MVAQMGPTSVGPVSVGAGVENPVWATTPLEILNSGGSTANPTELLTMYQYKFAAICRTDRKNHIHVLSAIADSEREARQQFCGKFVLYFHARLRVNGGAA